MRNLKLIVIFIVILFITGCTNKDLIKSYGNMKIGKNNIRGYILDLRIYGTNNGKKVNEILRITDYSNSEYEIVRTDTSIKPGSNDSRYETTYIKSGRVYIADKTGKYIETGESVYYKNPSIYLEGLKNIISSKKAITEKIGNNNYKEYKVVFKEDIIKSIINDTVLKGMKIEDNTPGEVYIDKDGYVYRIIYNISKVTINANYYSINKVKELNIPVNTPNEIDKGIIQINDGTN